VDGLLVSRDDARSAIRPRRGLKLPDLALTDQERTTLERWARRRTSSQALAERCRIVLACASGASNTEVAQRLGVARSTAIKRRSVRGPPAGGTG
jgi:DNA-binding NarL/FixJ family response regulator